MLSASDAGEAAEFAAVLRTAGLTVVVLDGRRLVGLPWPSPVSSIAFGDHGLRADVRSGQVLLRYDQPVVGVHCSPPADFSMTSAVNAADAVERGDGPDIAEAIQLRDVPQYELGSRLGYALSPQGSGVD